MLGLFSGKKDALIGIDISSVGVKLIELAHTRSGYELKSIAIVPLPRDAIVENTIIDSMAVSQALLDVLEVASPASRNVAFAVSGNAVIIKTVQLPMMSEFELEMSIEFEAEPHIPYDIEDVFLDFQILGGVEDEPEMMDVVLAACKREVIEDYQLVLNEAALQVKCVDCAVYCLENAAEIALGDQQEEESLMLTDEDSQVYALVNIGANMININIQQNGQTAFVRDQFFGGENLTEEIQKEHGVSYQAAEKLKKERFSEVSPEALDTFYIGLTSELVRSLDYYSAKYSEYPVQKLYISGGTALIPDITNELEQRLGIETEIVDPLQALKIPKKKFKNVDLSSIGPMMMVPIGLALRSFDK
ncbi:MAG: type IV pilus assembly protein PilM [Mariprofundaceae bacterium]|nr:type IV pilus assembly protein PilM [Mariprofundaceae bacterium]